MWFTPAEIEAASAFARRQEAERQAHYDSLPMSTFEVTLYIRPTLTDLQVGMRPYTITHVVEAKTYEDAEEIARTKQLGTKKLKGIKKLS
jgi:hypothetical protein